MPAAVHEDPEVAELLGDLVGGGDQPGHDPDSDVDHERAADRQAADQVVEPIGEQDQIAERTTIDTFGVFGAVTVVPVQELLEHEERQEAGHQREVDTKPVADHIDRLGEHVEEGPTE